MLPDRVTPLLSVNSLREDLEVSHRVVTNRLNILEAFYYCFRIYPYFIIKKNSAFHIGSHTVFRLSKP